MWLHDTLSQGFPAANTDRQQIVIITTAQCGARHMWLHDTLSQGFPAANTNRQQIVIITTAV